MSQRFSHDISPDTTFTNGDTFGLQFEDGTSSLTLDQATSWQNVASLGDTEEPCPNYSLSMDIHHQQQMYLNSPILPFQSPVGVDLFLPGHAINRFGFIQQPNTRQLNMSSRNGYPAELSLTDCAFNDSEEQRLNFIPSSQDPLINTYTAQDPEPPVASKKSKRKYRKRSVAESQTDTLQSQLEDSQFPMATSIEFKATQTTRERNRIAAKKCREKAKSKATELDSQVCDLFQERQSLIKEIRRLKDEHYSLKKLYLDHALCDKHHSGGPGRNTSTIEAGSEVVVDETDPTTSRFIDLALTTGSDDGYFSLSSPFTPTSYEDTISPIFQDGEPSLEGVSATADLRVFLDHINLSQYYRVLALAGYSARDDLLNITELQLSELGLELGHCRALQREIAAYRNRAMSSPFISPRRGSAMDRDEDE